MAFLGQVTIQLYYGTLYDDINVPYYSSQIEEDATYISRLAKAAVWQSTHLTTVVADVWDYQAVVGAQYASIDDLGGDNHGRHWYKILSYSQLSNHACLFQLEYDALLSIGIGNISGISGILRRWSVDDDTPFKWVKSAEPINQVDDYNYGYFRHNCASDLNAATGPQFYGFPYDLSKKPTIEEYENPNGEKTSIFLPQMEPTWATTVFVSSIGGEYYFNDGFIYWGRNGFRQTVLPNLNAAIGLGYELMSNCWALPNCPDYLEVTETSPVENAVSSVRGLAQVVETGFPLSLADYHNQKAGDMGLFLSLYNEVTGDCVTVEACDLSTTNLQVMCNPYINGSFAARFDGYLHDSVGYSGLVKSAGWLPVNYTLGVGAGTSAALMANAQQIDSVNNSYRAAIRSNNVSSGNLRRSRDMAYENTEYAQVRQTTQGAIGIASNPLNPMAWANGATDIAFSASDAMMANKNTDVAYKNAIDSATVAMQNAREARNAQIAMLSVNGDIGQTAPPPTKFSNAFDVNANSYAFIVRWASLSAEDRKRLDNFLTMYGYNVEGTILHDVNQLWTRQKFTFVQADEVEITAIKLGTSGVKRIRDYDTVEYIKSRFAAGLRIWHKTPDLDYTKANPIR